MGGSGEGSRGCRVGDIREGKGGGRGGACSGGAIGRTRGVGHEEVVEKEAEKKEEILI